MAAKRLTSAPAQSQQQDSSTTGNGGPPSPARGTPPVWKKRLFSSGSYLECAVFRNEVDHGQSSFVAFSVALDRRYKDGEGRWQTTSSLRRDDLLVAAHALQRAYAWISESDQQHASEVAAS